MATRNRAAFRWPPRRCSISGPGTDLGQWVLRLPPPPRLRPSRPGRTHREAVVV